MGISGGRRKIKSKELLDMRKGKNLQKGGQVVQGPPTNPEARTYISTKTDQEVLNAIRYCEAGHYSSARMSEIGRSFNFPNTDSAYDMLMLRQCIGIQLFGNDYSAAWSSKSSGQKASIAGITTALFPTATSFGPCTTDVNVRGTCPSGKRASSAMSTTKSIGIGKPLWTGGSRKKNLRSKAKRTTVKKRKY